MKRLIFLTTAVAFSASMAMAATTSGDLVAAYKAEGYTKIEVTTGRTQIKVEAVKGNSKIEVIYDAATGAILNQESKWAKRSDRGNGVALATSSDDFTDNDAESGDDDGVSDDDGAGHDMNDDHGDDDSGSDDGAGHDANDDHGGDDDGGDDDGADGGDHSGHGHDGNDD
jgi:hypothetical protein